MATITITIAAGQTYTRSKTVSGPHLARMFAAERFHLDMPGATDEAVFNAWFDQVVLRLAANRTRAAEAKAADDAVTDISFT